MTQFTEAVAPLVWTQLWQVTIVLTAVGITTRLFCRRRAHLAYMLWLVALVKCMTPPVWSSPTGVFSWAMPRVAATAGRPSGVEPARLGSLPVGVDENTSSDRRPGDTVLPPASPSSSRALTSESENTSGSVRAFEFGVAPALAWIWLAGAALYAGLALLAIAHCGRKIRTSGKSADGQIAAVFDDLRRRLGIRPRVGLLVVEEPLGPMTFGLVHPTVVLPRALTSRSPDDLAPLLAHELVHIRRGDALVGVLQTVAQCVWWFHPLVWWANREIVRDRERCCDEETVAGLACEPAQYARTLVDVLELKTQLHWLHAVPGVRSYEVTRKRLEHLMRRSDTFLARSPRSCWLILGLGIFLLVPGAAPTAVGQPGAPEHQRGFADALVRMPQSIEKAEARDQKSQAMAFARTRDSNEAEADESKPADREPYPQMVQSIPAKGETGVDPGLKEIRVTFDRDMQKGMSWTGGPPLFPPVDKKRKARWINLRTCVLPVQLQSGRFYRVGINSQSFHNFRSRGGATAPPSVLYFTTKGAAAEVNQRVRAPEIVAIQPANGAKDVDSATRELRVSFNVPMGKGMSWTGTGPQLPKAPDDQKAAWSSDGRTCTLPVLLEPGHDYELGLNDLWHDNFQSEWGVPLEPVIYRFHTRDGAR